MDLYDKIIRAANVEATVLIVGQSGTTRKLVAQMLHHNSSRKNGPFVAVNCAVVPARIIESELFGLMRGASGGYNGRLAEADGGTLFIDEVAHLKTESQQTLLRAIETGSFTPFGGEEARPVDVRVFSATSIDIATMVKEGRFREDLYYRLNVVTIDLRDRADEA